MAPNINKLKDKARKFELKEQPAKAIEIYLQILDVVDGTPEMDAELGLFNKVGDLYLKTNEVNSAVEMYERAANRYVESGLPNNAIALCNKILRTAPGRTRAYLMLGELMLQRGFGGEAKQYLIEYARRMSAKGQVEEAFKALKKFADASPADQDVRTMLTEQLEAAVNEDPENSDLQLLLQARRHPRRDVHRRRVRVAGGGRRGRHQRCGLPLALPVYGLPRAVPRLPQTPRRAGAAR